MVYEDDTFLVFLILWYRRQYRVLTVFTTEYMILFDTSCEYSCEYEKRITLCHMIIYCYISSSSVTELRGESTLVLGWH